MRMQCITNQICQTASVLILSISQKMDTLIVFVDYFFAGAVGGKVQRVGGSSYL